MKTSAQHFLIDALEGRGIVYWAEVKDIVYDAAWEIVSFKVSDAGYENERHSNKWTLINEKKVKEGAMMLLTGSVPVRRDIAAQFIGTDWDYDSEGV